MIIDERLKAESREEADKIEAKYLADYPVFGYSTRTRIKEISPIEFEVICSRMSSSD